MQFGVLVTNGPGGHPAWKHAEVSAWKLIIDPDPATPGAPEKTEAAALLRRKVRDVLEKHHEAVRQYELGELRKGDARLSAALEPQGDHLDAAVADIVALTKGTILEPHYAKPEVQQALRRELAVEFRTQQSIHRAWHQAGHRE